MPPAITATIRRAYVWITILLRCGSLALTARTTGPNAQNEDEEAPYPCRSTGSARGVGLHFWIPQRPAKVGFQQ